MKKVFIVRLTDEDRLELDSLICKGKASALTLTRARILLKADQGDNSEAWTDAEIAEALDVAPKTVFNIRRRWVEEGLEAALNRKKQKRPSRTRKLDGKAEAKLVATCCGPAPQGRARWTLRLLADQLVAEVRQPLPPEPGKPLRYDCEYERRGTCNIFMFCEPLRGWRHVRVTQRRTGVDWAIALRTLLDQQYQDAERVVLVMDNLNTHSPSSFYEAFAPQEARRLTERLDIHYTPKHGSWLNIAECEHSVLGRQCLARRIDDGQRLAHEVAAWERDRNANVKNVNWPQT